MSDDEQGPDNAGGDKRLVIRDFDPELHHRLKVLAAVLGTSMKEIVTAGSVRECERRELLLTSAAGTATVAAGTAARPAIAAPLDDQPGSVLRHVQ